MRFYVEINRKWVEPDLDLNVDNPLSLNWTFNSLENPVDYISEYSFEFQLPKTQRNKTIFDHLDILDSRALHPMKFPVNQSFKYIIQTDSDTISNGKCYLSDITDDYFVMHLSGALNVVFNQLLNSGWDDTREAENEEYIYLPNCEKQVLDKTLVSSAWDKTTYGWIYNKDNFLDFITFMVEHQGTYDDFDSQKTLNGELKEEVTEWQMCEYRSYEQRPAVFVQKLWDMYRQLCKTMTGYEMILDERWFNNQNGLLKNLVYTLPKLSKENGFTSSTEPRTITRSVQLPKYSAYSTSTHNVAGLQNISMWSVTNNFQSQIGHIIHYNWNLTLSMNNSSTYYSVISGNKSNPIFVIHKFYDSNNNLLNQHITLIVPLAKDVNSDGEYIIADPLPQVMDMYRQIADEVILLRYESQTPAASSLFLKFGFTGEIQKNFNYTGQVRAEMTVQYGNNQTPIGLISSGSFNLTYSATPITLNYKYQSNVNAIQNMRSGRLIDYKDIFQDVKPFGILLRYAKMVGLLFVVDDYNKTIKVIRRADYFDDLVTKDNNSKYPHTASDLPYTGFFDVTDYVDFKDYDIRPLSWDSRKVSFEYDESSDEYCKAYEDKYGRTYGSVLVNTNNKHNNETENLLCTSDYDTIKPSCDVYEIYKPMNVITNDGYDQFPSMIAPSNSEGDEYGAFYYRCQNMPVPTFMHHGGYQTDSVGDYVYLSDDTEKEQYSGNYCWHGGFFHLLHPLSDLKIRQLPLFKSWSGLYHFQFAQPLEEYYPQQPVLGMIGRALTPKYIYESEWHDYLQEVFNIENKTFIVNMAMDGLLYRRLKAVPLVIIGDVGYLVLEIADFKDLNGLTKVTLRQITNYSTLIKQKKTYTPIKNTNIVVDVEYEEVK